MNYDPALSAILADLKKIKHWCSSHPTEEMPLSAVRYLCANEATILCLIERLGTTSQDDRRTLFSQHRELDEGVISADGAFYRSLARKACDFEKYRLVVVTDDDVNMILRSIEYVKYLDCDSCPAVVLSPIELRN